MKQLILECGSDSIYQFWNFNASRKDPDFSKKFKEYQQREDTYPVDAIRNLKREVQERSGLDVEVVLYEGFDSVWCGGRPSYSVTVQEFLEEVSVANAAGAPYMLALNGGLYAKENDEPGDVEREALNALVVNNSKYGVRNKVTVLNDKIFQLIKDEFPELEVIASCIQQLDPNCHDSYRERFEKYDYVVIINQHSTFEFLKQYGEFADKIILFLLQGCSKADLKECYEHNRQYEWLHRHREGNLQEIWSKPEEYEVGEYHAPVPSQLKVDGESCRGGDLFKREDDLVDLIDMGVRGFKIARGEGLEREHLDILLGAIEKSKRMELETV